MAGDVEINPRPVNIIKCVQGTFHQGSVERLVDLTGPQCTCNALFAISWASVKNVGYWNSSDLDFVLYKGTRLYNDLGYTTQYLSVDDLPSEFLIENNLIGIEKLNNELHILTQNDCEYTLQRSRISNFEIGDGAICIISGISFAILWGARCVYIFDSHSRNALGEIAENGTSVLLKMNNLNTVILLKITSNELMYLTIHNSISRFNIKCLIDSAKKTDHITNYKEE